MGASCSHDEDEDYETTRRTREVGPGLGMPSNATPGPAPDVDKFIKQDPMFAPERIQERQMQYGLLAPNVKEFLDTVEFVSLGNYCAPSNALQAMGLRNFAYPLDWVRSPTRGIIQLFRSDFRDFFTGQPVPGGEHGVVYHNTAWGGSFWHHDIQNAKTKADLQRRVDRILGKKEVPKTQPHAFVRTVNSSEEIDQSFELHKALKSVYNAPVKLLTCIEFQSSEGPIGLQGHGGDDLLFYRVHEKYSFVSRLEERAQGYWAPIALAAKLWSGEAQSMPQVSSLQEVRSLCDPIDGGNPGTELFAAKKLGSSTTMAPSPTLKQVPGINKAPSPPPPPPTPAAPAPPARVSPPPPPPKKPTSNELKYQEPEDDEDGGFCGFPRKSRRTRGMDIDDDEVYMDANGFIRYVEDDDD
mmetsp:Transcript_52619/g.125694  ORF Transcript_52619/g.125694 Transcript_52619/m.125694 type:complete len:412 (+) Transcript_52619:109-1344(+)